MKLVKKLAREHGLKLLPVMGPEVGDHLQRETLQAGFEAGFSKALELAKGIVEKQIAGNEEIGAVSSLDGVRVKITTLADQEVEHVVVG